MMSRRGSAQAGSETATLRLKILERKNWRCQFCGTRSNLQIHHIVCRSQGGQESNDNLRECVRCKGVIHLEGALIFSPILIHFFASLGIKGSVRNEFDNRTIATIQTYRPAHNSCPRNRGA